MSGVREIATAEVDSDVEIGGATRDTVVVELDIAVEQGLGVFAVVFEPLEHLLGAEISEVRVVDGDVAAAGEVQGVELFMIGSGDVGEVSFVVGIDGGRVGVAGLVAEMVPFGGGEGELGGGDEVGGELGGEVGPLVDVGASFVLDLAGADYGLAWLMACFGYEGVSGLLGEVGRVGGLLKAARSGT